MGGESRSHCTVLRPGLAPAGDLLSLASPRESKQREGDPKSGSLRLRYGQPALLDSGGGPQNSPAAQTTAALIPPPSALLSPATRDKRERKPIQQGYAAACPWEVRYLSFVFLFFPPLVNAPRSAGSGGSGLALSERSEFSQPPTGPSTAGCPVAQRRGRRHQGRLSFAYFSLAKQRKVSCCRATPGPRTQQSLSTHGATKC